MLNVRLKISWRARESPLMASCVIGRGDAALTLGKRLLMEGDETLLQLSGVAGEKLLAVLGETERLPWVNDVVYLGRDAQAPSLYLPTAYAPDVPLSIFEKAILKHADGPPPFAVLLGPDALVPLQPARTIARETLQKWLEAQK